MIRSSLRLLAITALSTSMAACNGFDDPAPDEPAESQEQTLLGAGFTRMQNGQVKFANRCLFTIGAENVAVAASVCDNNDSAQGFKITFPLGVAGPAIVTSQWGSKCLAAASVGAAQVSVVQPCDINKPAQRWTRTFLPKTNYFTLKTANGNCLTLTAKGTTAVTACGAPLQMNQEWSQSTDETLSRALQDGIAYVPGETATVKLVGPQLEFPASAQTRAETGNKIVKWSFYVIKYQTPIAATRQHLGHIILGRDGNGGAHTVYEFDAIKQGADFAAHWAGRLPGIARLPLIRDFAGVGGVAAKEYFYGYQYTNQTTAIAIMMRDLNAIATGTTAPALATALATDPAEANRQAQARAVHHTGGAAIEIEGHILEQIAETATGAEAAAAARRAKYMGGMPVIVGVVLQANEIYHDENGKKNDPKGTSFGCEQAEYSRLVIDGASDADCTWMEGTKPHGLPASYDPGTKEAPKSIYKCTNSTGSPAEDRIGYTSWRLCSAGPPDSGPFTDCSTVWKTQGEGESKQCIYECKTKRRTCNWACCIPMSKMFPLPPKP